MPVVAIRALPQPGSFLPGPTCCRLALALAPIMGVPPRAVFVTWQEIPPDHYAEGDTLASTQPRDTHPPLVELHAWQGRSPETIETALTAIVTVLEEDLSLGTGNVFAFYTELTSGRVFTGGRVRR